MDDFDKRVYDFERKVNIAGLPMNDRFDFYEKFLSKTPEGQGDGFIEGLRFLLKEANCDYALHNIKTARRRRKIDSASLPPLRRNFRNDEAYERKGLSAEELRLCHLERMSKENYEFMRNVTKYSFWSQTGEVLSGSDYFFNKVRYFYDEPSNDIDYDYVYLEPPYHADFVDITLFIFDERLVQSSLKAFAYREIVFNSLLSNKEMKIFNTYMDIEFWFMMKHASRETVENVLRNRIREDTRELPHLRGGKSHTKQTVKDMIKSRMIFFDDETWNFLKTKEDVGFWMKARDWSAFDYKRYAISCVADERYKQRKGAARS